MGMGVAECVERWMRNIGFLYPSDIDLELMAGMLNLMVIRLPRPSAAFGLRNIRTRFVILSTLVSCWEQRLQLAHEIAHHILHCGDQLRMPCRNRDKQEAQADRLAHHILAPDYMLIPALTALLRSDRDVVAELSLQFDAPLSFMMDRLSVLNVEHPHIEAAATAETVV